MINTWILFQKNLHWLNTWPFTLILIAVIVEVTIKHCSKFLGNIQVYNQVSSDILKILFLKILFLSMSVNNKSYGKNNNQKHWNIGWRCQSKLSLRGLTHLSSGLRIRNFRSTGHNALVVGDGFSSSNLSW